MRTKTKKRSRPSIGKKRPDAARLVQSFLERNIKLSSEEVGYLDTFALSHLELIAKGGAEKESWQAVADAINMALVLSEIFGLSDQSGSALEAAHAAMVSLRDRKRSGLSLVAKASELDAIRVALDIASQLQEMCTRAHLRKAHDAIVRKVLKKKKPAIPCL